MGGLESRFGLNGIPVFESVASRGHGVMETARRVTQMVIERFQI
jgi:hypothetical protein